MIKTFLTQFNIKHTK